MTRYTIDRRHTKTGALEAIVDTVTNLTEASVVVDAHVKNVAVGKDFEQAVTNNLPFYMEIGVVILE